MLKKVIPIILLLTLAGFISVFGQVPKEMTYQGVLTDAAGVPLTGNYQLTFRMYDVASGGTELWTEIHSSVDVSNGLFRVHLGTVTALNLHFDVQYFVSVQVGSEPELGTRMRLTSVGYSFKSMKADSAENIATNVVNTANIQDGAVNSAKILDGTIQTSDLSYTPVARPLSPGVSTTEISDNAVTTNKILDGTIQTSDLSYTPVARPLSPGVSTAEISDNAVTTNKILDGTIQTSDLSYIPVARPLSPGVSTAEIADNSVTTAKIADGTVGTADLTNNAVTSLKIQDGTIQTSDLSYVPVARPLSPGVSTAEIADNAVNSVKIQDGTVTAADISTNIVSSAEGVTNDGGNINLIGSGITITGNDAANTITFTAPGIDGNTLDEAYDEGGPGLGRTITADAGAVNIAGIGGLETSGPIDHNYGAGGNGLNATGSTSAALYYISNGYAGSGWGLSAGMSSTSAGSSSYGVMGWNYGTGYGVYGRSLNASGTAVYGANTVSNDYAYLVGPSYAVYGRDNGGNYGYMGSGSYGVYGRNANTNYGYIGGSAYAIYGDHIDGNYGYVGGSAYGMYANLVTTDVGDYAIYGYGVDASGENGTGYGVSSTLGGVKGYNFYGNPYTFGVAGYSYLDYDRSGGCFGAKNTASVWGCLGYQNVGGTEYGCYATVYGNPIPEGQASVGIGLGSWGDLFGADIHGKIYGLYSEGSNYALYTNGTVFKNDLDVHLQKTESSAMSVLYTNVSTDVTVQTSGYSKMSAGKCQIEFDENFKRIVSDKVPVVVTITPIGNSKGVFVASVDKNGFAVVENDNGKSSVDIAFIAIGRRAGFENPILPDDVISSDYTKKLARGLHNDALDDNNGEGLYYENGTLYVGRHYSTQPDLSKVEEEQDKRQERETPQPPPKDTNDNNGKAPDKTR